jgi:peptide/nickel transport system permease protein
MRTNDAVMAIPGLLMALLLVSTLGNGASNAVIAIALAFAPGMARVTRSAALNVRNQDYVKAAIARGEGAPWIIFREMLPNIMAPIVIESTIRVSFAVMLFATLSFLGVGAQPPASEWGLMVADARQYLHQAPWGLIAPSTAIALTAIAFNLVGDGLRDALNPKDAR